MRLYLSSNYTDFYTSKLFSLESKDIPSSGPPVLSLNDDLFIEVNLERPLISEAFAPYTEFSTVMENCWGTPSQSRDGALKVREAIERNMREIRIGDFVILISVKATFPLSLLVSNYFSL